MSTEIALLEPLCQAAIITVKPYTHFLQITSFFIVTALIVKLIASLLKTKLKIRQQVSNEQLPTQAKKIINKHHFSAKNITILQTSSLVAFSSVVPGIANGIFLSKGIFKKLSEQEQEAVFLHELYHWQSKQTMHQLLLKLLADVFFFIPIIKDLLDHWLLQSELDADAFAADQLQSSLPLKQALSKWLNQTNQQYAWTISFSESQLEKRIEVLVESKPQSKKSFQVSFKSVSISLVVLVTLMLVGASDYSKTEATFIIPTNSQCKRLWQQSNNQSNADAIMSPKLED